MLYEHHRVSALLQADELEVISRREIALTNIRASLYAENGEITSVQCEKAGYDFKKKTVVAQSKAEVKHPHFSARGAGVTFSTAGRIGLIKGPVRTTIRSEKSQKSQ